MLKESFFTIEDATSALYSAVVKLDTPEVERLIGVIKLLSKNSTAFELYSSSLCGAVRNSTEGNYSESKKIITLLLLRAKVCASKASPGTTTPLLYALKSLSLTREQIVDLAKLLLKHGAKKTVNNTDSDKKSALHYAVDLKSISLVRKLLFCGAEINAQDDKGCTPLALAATYRCDPEMVEELLLRGGDVNILPHLNRPLISSLVADLTNIPLESAQRGKTISIAKKLISYGASLDEMVDHTTGETVKAVLLDQGLFSLLT